MNNVTGLDANTSYSPSQKKKKKPSAEQSALSDADKQIMKAMGLLANVLRSARREAGEATIDPTRKAELEAWIEQHAAEIDARIEKLGAFVGLGVDPEKDAELSDLLKATDYQRTASGLKLERSTGAMG